MILLISEMHLSYVIQGTQKYAYDENINGQCGEKFLCIKVFSVIYFTRLIYLIANIYQSILLPQNLLSHFSLISLLDICQKDELFFTDAGVNIEQIISFQIQNTWQVTALANLKTLFKLQCIQQRKSS